MLIQIRDLAAPGVLQDTLFYLPAPLPVLRMGSLPRTHTRRVLGAAEVIVVLRLIQPAPLTRRLARAATRWLAAVFLSAAVAGIGTEKLSAMSAARSSCATHGIGSLP